MTYILIVLWLGTASAASGKAALAVEFNDLASCRTAAAEILKQEQNDTPPRYRAVGTILCAQKGAK